MESQKQVKEMKRVTKIIALASLFSFIISYSSFISSLQQRLHLLSMYSNLVDKKYMFLLCNGIVGFIVGSFRGNSETLLHDYKTIKIVEEAKQVAINEDLKETKAKKAVALLGEKSISKEEEEEEKAVLLREEEEEEDEVTLVVEDDEGILVQDLAFVRRDDHNDQEINDSLLSSEDLNKKCEDFIRKMKAEIRFGIRST